MEPKRRGTTSSNDVLFSTLILIIIVLCSSGSFVVVDAYKNYTVGDSLGWFDSTMNSEINYQKWASNKVFSLGDFLSASSVLSGLLWKRNHGVCVLFSGWKRHALLSWLEPMFVLYAYPVQGVGERSSPIDDRMVKLKL